MKKIVSIFLVLTLSLALVSCSNSGGNQQNSKEYNVTLRGNGGTPISSSITVTYGKAMPSANKPSRSGYTFLGYYDSMYVVSGTQYYNSSMKSVRNWDKESGGTLYALWKLN